MPKQLSCVRSIKTIMALYLALYTKYCRCLCRKSSRATLKCRTLCSFPHRRDAPLFAAPSVGPTNDDLERSSSKLVIDNVPIRTVMAPMVAASDYAFRRLARNYDTDLCFTQMLHARNVVKDAMFRRNHLDFTKCQGEELPKLLQPQQNCIIGAEDYGLPPPRRIAEGEKGPLIVQIAGHDPHIMVQAAHLLLEESSPNAIQGFDVNLGCPQGIARKGNYGAFLMERDVDVVTEILSQLRQSLPSSVKVSAKIRLPVSLDQVELQKKLHKLVEIAGIDFVTIHGRTLEENKTKTGPCRVDMLRQAVSLMPHGFPMISNGGIEGYHDVAQLMQETGATAVMSSEALLETPNLFVQGNGKELTPRQLLEQQLRVAREYVSLAAEYPPLPGVLGHVGGSFNIVRGHLFKILHRYIQENADLRIQLASHKFTNLGQAMKLLDELEGRYSVLTDAQLQQCVSSDRGSSWYRRHWSSSRQVHTKRRGGARQTPAEDASEMSVEDRKKEMQERIARLREQRQRRRGSSAISTTAVETERVVA